MQRYARKHQLRASQLMPIFCWHAIGTTGATQIPLRGKRVVYKGGSPGLVVMGRDSRSKGRGFESQHRILDGHFSQTFVLKIVMNCNE